MGAVGELEAWFKASVLVWGLFFKRFSNRLPWGARHCRRANRTFVLYCGCQLSLGGAYQWNKFLADSIVQRDRREFGFSISMPTFDKPSLVPDAGQRKYSWIDMKTLQRASANSRYRL
jgi:hypothetical protein